MVLIVSLQAAGRHYLFRDTLSAGCTYSPKGDAVLGNEGRLSWGVVRMDRSFLVLLAFAGTGIIGAFAFAALWLMWWAAGSI
jgi:hypothetical protein